MKRMFRDPYGHHSIQLDGRIISEKYFEDTIYKPTESDSILLPVFRRSQTTSGANLL